MGPFFDIPAQLAMLLSLAAASAGHPDADTIARAATESPAAQVAEPLEGPMRFGERAWLRALHENAAQSAGYASRVFVTSGGRIYVPTEGDRRQILSARSDAAVAPQMARAAAERNAAELSAALGRSPSPADLFIAHVLGPDGATAFLKAVGERPGTPLNEAYPALLSTLTEPKAAAALRLTVGDFYRRLCATLRAPPRLVAIGLKPSVEVAPPPPVPSWRVKVDIANVEHSLR